jgi:hypothetical protein
MKAKNFRNGVEVRIKPNAVGHGIGADFIGRTGILTNVRSHSPGDLHGGVLGWTVQPQHVSLVKPEPPAEPIATQSVTELKLQPLAHAGRIMGETAAQLAAYASAGRAMQPETETETELTPGFYVDGDNDLWIVVDTGPDARVVNIVSGADIRHDEIRRTRFDDGDTIPDFLERWTEGDTRPSWWPLRRLADLPKQ